MTQPMDNNSQDSINVSKASTSTASWGPIAGLVYGLLVAFIGGSIIASLLTTVALTFVAPNDQAIVDWQQSIVGVLVTSFMATVFTAGAIFAYVKWRGGTLLQLGIQPIRLRDFWVAIIGMLTYLLTYIVIVAVAHAFVPALDLEQKQDLGFADPEGFMQLAAAFLTLVVLPPIVEELVFRGFIFGGLRKRFNFLITAIATSVVFALGHLQFGNDAPLLWVAAIDTFVLSMVMCFVRERTGSIVPTVIMHALKNCLAFTFLFLIPFMN